MNQHLNYLQNIFFRLLKNEITESQNILVPINERSKALLSCLINSQKENEIWKKIIIRNISQLNFELLQKNSKNISIILFTDVLEKESNLVNLYINLKEKGLNSKILALKENIDFFKDLDNENSNNSNINKINETITDLKQIFNKKNERHRLITSDITRYLTKNRILFNNMNEFSYSLPFYFTAKTTLEEFETIKNLLDYTYIKNSQLLYNNIEIDESFFISKNNSNNNPDTFHIFKHVINNKDNNIILKFSNITLLPEIDINHINIIFNILYKNSNIQKLNQFNNFKEQYHYILLYYGYYQTELFKNNLEQYIPVENIKWDFTSPEISNYLNNISLEEKKENWNLIKEKYLPKNIKDLSFKETRNYYTSDYIHDLEIYLRSIIINKQLTLKDIDIILEKFKQQQTYNQNNNQIKNMYSKTIVSTLMNHKLETDISTNKHHIQLLFKEGAENYTFLEKNFELLIQFCYAYYLIDINNDKEKYKEFIKWLKAYLYTKGLIPSRIQESTFIEFTKLFFENKKKIIETNFQTLQYSNKQNKIHFKVLEWKF